MDRHSSTMTQVTWSCFEAVGPALTARSTRDWNGETVAADNGTQRDRDLRAARTLSAASRRTTEGPVTPSTSRRVRLLPGQVVPHEHAEGSVRRAHPPRIDSSRRRVIRAGA